MYVPLVIHTLIATQVKHFSARIRKEGNNRSVIPLDVLGRTRATLTMSESVSFIERCG